MATGSTHWILGWCTSGSQNVVLGILPVGAVVLRGYLHVTQAFNSDGTDNIQCGHDGDNDAYFTNTDVSSTGVKSVTLGAGIGYDATARQIEVYYTNGGSEPTTGKALCGVEYFLVPRSP